MCSVHKRGKVYLFCFVLRFLKIFLFFSCCGRFLYTWRGKSSPHVAFSTWLLPFNLAPANKRKSIFQGPSSDRKCFFRRPAGTRPQGRGEISHQGGGEILWVGEREKKPPRELLPIAAGGNKVQARCGAGREPGSAACTEGRCRSTDLGLIPLNRVGHGPQSSVGGKASEREATDSQRHVCKASTGKRARNSLQEGS